MSNQRRRLYKDHFPYNKVIENHLITKPEKVLHFAKNILNFFDQNIEIWQFSIFTKFLIFFSKNDRKRSIAPLNCHWIMPQFIYKRIETNQRKESISKTKTSHFLKFFNFFENYILLPKLKIRTHLTTKMSKKV